MENEFIIILSVPFIRTLDLSKPEIALLVFEDYIRLRQGHFINFVKDSEVEGFIGKNFDGKAIPTSVTKKVLAKSLSVASFAARFLRPLARKGPVNSAHLIHADPIAGRSSQGGLAI